MGNNTRLLILALGLCTLSQAAHAGRLIREERGKSQTQGRGGSRFWVKGGG